jgi:dinuclear metal center YbgI/SA1388 family protein
MELKVGDFVSLFQQIAPFHLQESYDNSGLLTGSYDTVVSKVMLCLDMTEEVLEEAIEKGCNLIIGHHPIIFKGLKRINGNNYVERVVIKAIKQDLMLLAVHTNLDNVLLQGVNQKIADKLELSKIEILAPKSETDARIGAGCLGYLNAPMLITDFLNHVKSSMQTSCIRYSGNPKTMIHKVAICGGSGSFLLPHAIKEGAHAYVSADFKYHEFFDAEDKILVADIGHYESEQYTIELFNDILRNNFPNFAVHMTSVNTNPIKYYS